MVRQVSADNGLDGVLTLVAAPSGKETESNIIIIFNI